MVKWTKVKEQETKYSSKGILLDRAGGSQVKIGKPAANSVLTGGLQTHSTVTGGVALYMPPGIKASYSAETGHSELGKAVGMMAEQYQEQCQLQILKASIRVFKRYWWWYVNSC